jgi:hypothetical protein
VLNILKDNRAKELLINFLIGKACRDKDILKELIIV